MPGLIGRNVLTTESIANMPAFPVCNVAVVGLYTAVAGDVIDRFGGYFDDFFGSSGNIEVGVYSILAGVVGNLVSSVFIDPVNAAPQWYYSATGLGIPLVAGTQYCISMVGTITNPGRLFYLTVASSRDNGFPNPGTALPASWTNLSYSNGSFLAFADVIAGAPPVGVAGADTFKRDRILEYDE